MGRYNFEGDTNGVSEKQLEYITEVLEKLNVKGSNVQFEPVGKVGDNYVADVKRITVNNDGEVFKMVAKVAPKHEAMRRATNIPVLFFNEHVTYTELLPKFHQLQKEAGVPKEELFRYPKCYGSSSEKLHEIILLEDLKESEFDIVSRFKPMSNECVKIALKNLAKFHSFSYVLKKLEPETYDAIKSKLSDLITEHMAVIPQMKAYFEGLEQQAIHSVTDLKHKNVIKGTVSEMINHGTKCLKSDKNSKFSVIRQGDGWTNNIMFRLKDGIPQECVLIDYQLVYEASPAYDIMYMLFNSTDHVQRHNHYHSFIDFYYFELDKSLNYFGLKANLTYPKDQLDVDLQRYGKYGFSCSVLISSVIIKTSKEAAAVKKSMENPDEENSEKIFEQDHNTALQFKKKMEDLADSFLEFGLLSDKNL